MVGVKKSWHMVKIKQFFNEHEGKGSETKIRGNKDKLSTAIYMAWFLHYILIGELSVIKLCWVKII
jgi:hypothetical protein